MRHATINSTGLAALLEGEEEEEDMLARMELEVMLQVIFVKLWWKGRSGG